MPDSNSSESLEEYIDLALLLSGSSFTVGFVDKEPCNPTEPDTPEPLHIMAITPESLYTPIVLSGVLHTMTVQPESVHVMPATPEPSA